MKTLTYFFAASCMLLQLGVCSNNLNSLSEEKDKILLQESLSECSTTSSLSQSAIDSDDEKSDIIPQISTKIQDQNDTQTKTPYIHTVLLYGSSEDWKKLSESSIENLDIFETYLKPILTDTVKDVLSKENEDDLRICIICCERGGEKYSLSCLDGYTFKLNKDFTVKESPVQLHFNTPTEIPLLRYEDIEVLGITSRLSTIEEEFFHSPYKEIYINLSLFIPEDKWNACDNLAKKSSDEEILCKAFLNPVINCELAKKILKFDEENDSSTLKIKYVTLFVNTYDKNYVTTPVCGIDFAYSNKQGVIFSDRYDDVTKLEFNIEDVSIGGVTFSSRLLYEETDDKTLPLACAFGLMDTEIQHFIKDLISKKEK